MQFLSSHLLNETKFPEQKNISFCMYHIRKLSKSKRYVRNDFEKGKNVRNKKSSCQSTKWDVLLEASVAGEQVVHDGHVADQCDDEEQEPHPLIGGHVVQQPGDQRVANARADAEVAVVGLVVHGVLLRGDHQVRLLQAANPGRAAVSRSVAHAVAELPEVSHEALATDQAQGERGAIMEADVRDRQQVDGDQA